MQDFSVPRYGLADYYIGEAGFTYFEKQGRGRDLDGRIESTKFSKHIQRNDVVLDFGCGGGWVLAALRCARRLGVEPNPAARGVAVANGIECYATLAEVGDRVADIGISNHALEHVPYPIEALRQLKTKIKPGGLLLIYMPLEDWRVYRRYRPHNSSHHLHAWNPQVLGNALATAGYIFSPDDIRIYTHCWPPFIYQSLYQQLPRVAFDLVCNLCARLLRQRQLAAVLRV
jgi:SAM-dependent methyltransferase